MTHGVRSASEKCITSRMANGVAGFMRWCCGESDNCKKLALTAMQIANRVRLWLKLEPNSQKANRAHHGLETGAPADVAVFPMIIPPLVTL